MPISNRFDPAKTQLGRRMLVLRRSTTSPRKRIASRRRSVIPWGVVGAVALMVVIERWVGRNWLDFSDPVSLSWRFSAEAAAARASHCDIICLGDSLVK